jgi:hypothetical protein
LKWIQGVLANMSLLQRQASAYLASTSTQRGIRRQGNAMNLYTGLLFLHGHIADPSLLDDTGYATSTYGNKVANARALRAPWGREDDVADGDKQGGEAKAA